MLRACVSLWKLSVLKQVQDDSYARTCFTGRLLKLQWIFKLCRLNWGHLSLLQPPCLGTAKGDPRHQKIQPQEFEKELQALEAMRVQAGCEKADRKEACLVVDHQAGVQFPKGSNLLEEDLPCLVRSRLMVSKVTHLRPRMLLLCPATGLCFLAVALFHQAH